MAPHQTRWTDFDDKILSMYARGMSTREIQGHLEEIYHVDVSPALISSSIVVGPRPAFHETNPVAPNVQPDRAFSEQVMIDTPGLSKKSAASLSSLC